MKYIIPILLSVLTAISISPWVVAAVDIYWTFFTNTSLSGLKYDGSEGFIRALAMLFSLVPTVIFGALLIPSIEELRYKIALERIKDV